MRTAPGASSGRGLHQATDQSFLLDAEARANDAASFFLEFRLFDDPRNAYLGDSPLPRDCNGEESSCKDRDGKTRYQHSSEPGYKKYVPKVSKAYFSYAFDYCILDAGRRGRDWGLGLFMDSGTRPFSIASSIYDGINCHVNLQKFQDMGVSFGIDKLAETGRDIRSNPDDPAKPGPSNIKDDMDQYYFSIYLDDRTSHPNATFNKHIGFYVANIRSGALDGGGAKTEMSVADMYLAFYFPRITWRNEFIFRLGKSADPNYLTLGGGYESSGEPTTNNLNAIGFGGNVDWLMSGPRSTQESSPYASVSGNRHILFLDYAFAPGDRDGYYNDFTGKTDLGIQKRDGYATALAFHPNFSPALILFTGRSEIDDLKVDGVFDPVRIMNAQVYSLGYRFEGVDIGNFETRLLYSFLNMTPQDEVINHYRTQKTKPVGYYGDELGLELDLKYWRSLSKGIDGGLATGALFPGKAWQVEDEEQAKNSYLIQAFLTFNF